MTSSESILKPWASIVGEHFPDAYYIDCFAGRGKYHKDGLRDQVLGSPLLAQAVALETQAQKQRKGKEFRLKVVAVEDNKENIADLDRFLKDGDPDSKVSVKLLRKEFQASISDIIATIGSSPALFFVDPYGIKTIPKETLDLIVDRAAIQQRTEIFVNYMQMGVTRIAGLQKTVAHPEESIRVRAIKTLTHLDNLFGDRSWINKDKRQLLRHFSAQVLRRGYKVVLNFDVPYPDRSGTFYNLIFATNDFTARKIMNDIFTKKLFEGTLFEERPFKVEHEL